MPMDAATPFHDNWGCQGPQLMRPFPAHLARTDSAWSPTMIG